MLKIRKEVDIESDDEQAEHTRKMKVGLSKNLEKDTKVARQKLTDKRLKLKAKLRAARGETNEAPVLGSGGSGSEGEEGEESEEVEEPKKKRRKMSDIEF